MNVGLFAGTGFLDALEEAEKATPASLFGFARPREEALGRPHLPLGFQHACRSAFSALAARMPGNGVIAVVSPHRGEGRSHMAAGLAGVIAGDTGSQVLLVELDFEQPSLARLFRVSPLPGLADHLEGRGPLRVLGGAGQAIQLITAGGREGSVAALLHRAASLGIEQAVSANRWVVLDLPPLLDRPEAGILLSMADAFVLVGRYRQTLVSSLHRAARLLPERPAGFFMAANSSRVPVWLSRLL